jgi:hypothetical protein
MKNLKLYLQRILLCILAIPFYIAHILKFIILCVVYLLLWLTTDKYLISEVETTILQMMCWSYWRLWTNKKYKGLQK